jgi:hypothetical protein
MFYKVLERELNGITININADLATYDGLHWDLIMHSPNNAVKSERIILTVRGASQVLQILEMFLCMQVSENIITNQKKDDLYSDIRQVMLNLNF